MSFAKWIGGALGWSFGGPIGAIIGLAIGSLIDGATEQSGSLLGEGQSSRRRSSRRSDHYRSTRQTRTRAKPTTQSGDFEVSLLILASVVIKADGRQDQAELDYVRSQFVSMYGKSRANQAFNLFKKINQQQVPTRKVCLQIKQMMDHASRLQLLHFLFGIAKADGMVTEPEVKQMQQVQEVQTLVESAATAVAQEVVLPGDPKPEMELQLPQRF